MDHTFSTINMYNIRQVALLLVPGLTTESPRWLLARLTSILLMITLTLIYSINHDVDYVDDDDNQSNLHQREGGRSRPNSRKSSVNEQPHRSLQGLAASVLLIISLCSLLCYHHHVPQSAHFQSILMLNLSME